MKFYDDQQNIDNFQDSQLEEEIRQEAALLEPQTIENPYTQEKITGEPLPGQPEVTPVSDTEYDDARNKSEKLDLYANLLRSFQGFNQAAGQTANPNYKADMGVADSLSKQADAEMKEYYKKIDRLDIQNEEKLRDANSEESKFAQEYVMKIDPNVNPETLKKQNAWNLYRLYPKMQQLVVNKMKVDKSEGLKKRYQFPVGMQDGVPTVFTGDTFTGELKATDVQKGYSPKVTKDPITGKFMAVLPDGTTKPISSLDDLNNITEPKDKKPELSAYEKIQANAPNISKQFDEQVIKEYNKETKDDENLMYKFDEINNLIDKTLQDPKSTQFGVLAGQVTRLIEKGVLTDKDLDRYVSAYDLAGKFKDTMSKYIKGNPTPETLNRIKGTLANLQQSRQKVLSNRALDSTTKFYNRHKNRLEGLGISAKDLVPMIESQSLTGSNEIKRKTRDGRTAVFDQNKKFIRYED